MKPENLPNRTVENNTSARSSDLTVAWCDLDLLTSWPQKSIVSAPCLRTLLGPICIKIGLFVFKILRSQVW